MTASAQQISNGFTSKSEGGTVTKTAEAIFHVAYGDCDDDYFEMVTLAEIEDWLDDLHHEEHFETGGDGLADIAALDAILSDTWHEYDA